jgi:secondary thiamine-phosphate synthase enzyme
MSPARFEAGLTLSASRPCESRTHNHRCLLFIEELGLSKIEGPRSMGPGVRRDDCIESSFMTAAQSISRSALSTASAASIVSSLLTVQTSDAGFVDLTAEVAKFISDAGAREGAVTLFIRHTSASLTIQENADPSVLADLMTALDRFAPEDAGWRHDTEGPDDMPAHVKTMLTASSLHIPVLKGELALGTWQAIYLIEHRSRPHRREIVLQFAGATG